MTATRALQRTYQVAATITLSCIPGIFLAEGLGWSQMPFHVTQFAAVVICWIASVASLFATGGEDPVAGVCALLSSSWLAFIGVTLLLLRDAGS